MAYTNEEIKEVSEWTEPDFIDLLIRDSRVPGKSLGEIRRNFCRSLGIPQRTLESWIYHERKCPDYVIGLMANRIFGKMINRHPIYRVYKMGRHDEWEIYTTEGYIDAVIEARREVRKIKQTRDKDEVEIRLYQDNPEDEDADLTNCELVSFK